MVDYYSQIFKIKCLHKHLKRIHSKRKTTENRNPQRARRKDAEPINRAISPDLLALYIWA